MSNGDTLLGDTLRSTVAAVCVCSLLNPESSQDLAVVNIEGPLISEGELMNRLSALAV